MEPAAFGPFLKEERQRCGLTQSQLAERLHVSTAAVSKWERAKCLPDISKLEEIAAALDLSVLEILQCERLQTADIERKTLADVYTETLKTARGQQKRHMFLLLKTVACLIAVVCVLHVFPIYRIAAVWQPSYYTTGEVSLLAYIGSPRERAAAQPVMALAERAFSDLTSTRVEAERVYGLLSRYCIGGERGIARETHFLRLWSARFRGGEGYLWVYYTQEGRDAAGALVTGSASIPALWYLKQDGDGNWYVSAIKEHP